MTGSNIANALYSVTWEWEDGVREAQAAGTNTKRRCAVETGVRVFSFWLFSIFFVQTALHTD